ncbi:DNA alkylation repair protein [bacterium]|jgi:3-methyladenine DNA glycosylase AlkD|nr:DNA alkylation repair protein [bacterium]MBT3581806.1 DNA alkylation repair protein [bacterium]MBT4552496.1 DNA alkylation repair protein [bacterium]MBT7087964.1 DNA alkylation repair protein [bacterium]
MLPIQQEIRSLSDPEKACHAQRFFKTAPGEYGAGDKFLGVRVPVLRALSKKYRNIPLPDAFTLLQSKFHEERLLALFILVLIFKKAKDTDQKQIYDFYLEHTKYINNWDLVDSSAHLIVGPYLQHRDRAILSDLAKSKLLWDRRIAMLSTFHYIRQKDFGDALKIAEILQHDQEDLMHKAVGWMLREIGNRDLATEEVFLKKYYQNMPRTMLRYAIEKFEEEKRLRYLKGEA